MPTGVQRLSPSHSAVCSVDSRARMFLSLPSVHSRSCGRQGATEGRQAPARTSPAAGASPTEPGSDQETCGPVSALTPPGTANMSPGLDERDVDENGMRNQGPRPRQDVHR